MFLSLFIVRQGAQDLIERTRLGLVVMNSDIMIIILNIGIFIPDGRQLITIIIHIYRILCVLQLLQRILLLKILFFQEYVLLLLGLLENLSVILVELDGLLLVQPLYAVTIIVRLLAVCNGEFTDFIFQVVYDDSLYFVHHLAIVGEYFVVEFHHGKTFWEDRLRRHLYLLICQRHLLQRHDLDELLNVPPKYQLKYFFKINSLLFLDLSQIPESFPLKLELVDLFQEISSIRQLQCLFESLSNFHDLLLLRLQFYVEIVLELLTLLF